MLDKARLGIRYSCFECGTKFYDLNREVPTCPECSADQREAPQRDIRSLLGKGGGRRRAEKAPEPDPKPEPAKDEDESEDEDEAEDEDEDEEAKEKEAGW